MKLNPKLKPGNSRKNLLFASLTLFMLFTSLFACVHVSNVKGQTEKLAKPNTTTTATVVGRGVVNTQKPQTPNVTLTPNATMISKNEQTQNSNTKNRYTLIGLIFALVITFLIVFFMDHPDK